MAVRNISSWSSVIVQCPSLSDECPLPKFFASPASTQNKNRTLVIHAFRTLRNGLTGPQFRARAYICVYERPRVDIGQRRRHGDPKRWHQNAAVGKPLTDFDLQSLHDSEVRFTLGHRHFAQTRWCTSAANSSTTFHSKM